ncbi:MutS-related protein [Clostridium sporogenes]|uniref:MutS-related protein n=1 Tax=Clostridium sporogenes TaxID=1509 RepID=UPI003F916BE6
MYKLDIFILVLILVMLSMYFWNYRQRLRYVREKIINSWGKKKKKNYTEEEMISILSYFKNTKDKKTFFIDDITWNDLNMDEVFSIINNTQSSVGEEFLYNTLREPLFDERKLKERDSIVEYFSCNEKERVETQYVIAKFGKDKIACISDFFNNVWIGSNKLSYYRILSFMPVIFIGVFLLTKVAMILLITLILIIFNSFIHYFHFRKNVCEIRRFNYIASMILCAERITKLQINHIKSYFPTIEYSIKNLKNIKNSSFTFFDPDVTNDMDIIMDYIKMFFLLDVIKFEKTNLIIGKNKDDLEKIYEFIGTIDCCISIASYRKSLKYYTKPVFVSLHGSKQLKFKDMYHPLIKEPVSNSCEIYKSILITGSNASGKSTFLKTVAINSILGQTIYTCLANKYKSSYFKIYTSMALRDNLTGNDSYYIVEIKSLKRIMENINDKIPCLCIIDEILRGTNTVERIAASSEVLNSIANGNCLCLSATHDLELTSILNIVFDNYHFQENITRDKIIFDYKLYHGISETRNAIKLLSIMGYSDVIVSNAEKMADNFLNSGIWNEIQ